MARNALDCFAALAMTVLTGIVPSFAQAQAYQCRVPTSIAVPKITREASARKLPVTGYTLALSWSPEFCKRRSGEARHRSQCSGRNGRFGFTVHGLWPEGRGNWPQWCTTSRSLAPAEARRNMCMSPSAALQARQWAKHGSCMVRTPESYFKVTRILWDSLRFPDTIRLSRQEGLTAGAIRTAFVTANPAWNENQIGVRLNARGWLEEVQLCYSKRFMPVKCDARRFGAKDSAPAKIWRGL